MGARYLGSQAALEYGDAGIETYREFVGLRYALFPYIYTYSRVAHDSGMPLVRGMYLEYPNLESAYASDQQFMFGKEFLVAPITGPGEGKPAQREVILPAGDDWYELLHRRHLPWRSGPSCTNVR